MCYNHAAGRFHLKKHCNRFYSIVIEFYLKNKTKKLLFEHPFGRLRGNVGTPSIARWKARGRLLIRLN